MLNEVQPKYLNLTNVLMSLLRATRLKQPVPEKQLTDLFGPEITASTVTTLQDLLRPVGLDIIRTPDLEENYQYELLRISLSLRGVTKEKQLELTQKKRMALEMFSQLTPLLYPAMPDNLPKVVRVAINKEAFERTKRFVKSALKDRAHLKLPKTPTGRELNENTWVREKNAVGIYIGSPAVLEDVGRFVLGLEKKGRERPRQVIKEGLKNLWNNASARTKQEFPWRSFSLDKPVLLRNRIRHSLSLGGTSANIAELIKEGYSYTEITGVGYSDEQISSSRKTLPSWGIEVPSKPKPPTLAEKLQTENDLVVLQQFMDQVTYSYYCYRKDLFMGVQTAAKLAGFHFPWNKTQLFVKSLEGKIPMAHVSFRIRSGEKIVVNRTNLILTRQLDMAKEKWLADQTLREYLKSVTEQLGGLPSDSPPSYKALRKGDLYKTFVTLRPSTGFTLLGKKRLAIESFLRNCPVPVFRYDQAYFYPADQEEALENYLKSYPTH